MDLLAVLDDIAGLVTDANLLAPILETSRYRFQDTASSLAACLRGVVHVLRGVEEQWKWSVLSSDRLVELGTMIGNLRTEVTELKAGAVGSLCPADCRDWIVRTRALLGRSDKELRRRIESVQTFVAAVKFAAGQNPLGLESCDNQVGCD